MKEETEILVELWKETRECINHLDRMMDGVRLRVFTLFGTLTSVAAALYYWAPNAFISNIRLSAFVELSLLFVLIPSMLQNRLYHYWLFKAINTSLDLENFISQELKIENPPSDLMVTHSLTGLKERSGSYCEAMKRSKLFWVEIAIFIFLIIACLILSYIFLVAASNVNP
ncbi:MAG: hypothetical protein QHH17_03820 [Candidatus Bathyarchaeota archaeon]|jgi:hypothetical protein|nr:hypothetical protein [Candidatus Bathyarchaeota archaeon]